MYPPVVSQRPKRPTTASIASVDVVKDTGDSDDASDHMDPDRTKWNTLPSVGSETSVVHKELGVSNTNWYGLKVNAFDAGGIPCNAVDVVPIDCVGKLVPLPMR